MPSNMIDANRFKTGLKWMDLHHTELVNMTLDLFSSIEQGKPERNAAGLLEFLDRYVSKHFSIEAEYMLAYDYPEKDSHLSEHTIFEYTLSGLKAEFHASGSSRYLSGKVKRHLLDWLVNHIGETDKRLAEFLLKKGLAPDAPAIEATAKPSLSQDQEEDVEKKYC